ncbi:hypothetical protein KC356_g85 [Hortaea werneckii]|nr:hypothetical protein KC356_g85 [Hortaea werneckii]
MPSLITAMPNPSLHHCIVTNRLDMPRRLPLADGPPTHLPMHCRDTLANQMAIEPQSLLKLPNSIHNNACIDVEIEEI